MFHFTVVPSSALAERRVVTQIFNEARERSLIKISLVGSQFCSYNLAYVVIKERAPSRRRGALFYIPDVKMGKSDKFSA